MEKMFKTKRKRAEGSCTELQHQNGDGKRHKRWLKDETGAKKKSRTLIDARHVMFEEDSRSPPTGL